MIVQTGDLFVQPHFSRVCVLLMKPAKALAVKSVQKENA